MNLWKRKLAAYLHDPPSKALDIRTHGERSDAAFRQAGFVDTEVGDYFRVADHVAAAADRIPFPSSQTSGLRCAFDGRRNAFRHPLSGDRLEYHAPFATAELGIEGEGVVQPALSASSLQGLAGEDLQWRARFMAHWRLWPDAAMKLDYRMAFLPADTRIPDHTIWTHMQVVSALAGCVGEDKSWHPAFLKFQLGPVQEFIAAARSIRDLWSGSYLLSWLMAAGLKALSAEIGPDAVIFPNLRGQPLFDLHWKEELWSRVSINDQASVWQSLGWNQDDLLTPNLPNVFLAVVPADCARDLARKVEASIRDEWRRIAEAVWQAVDSAELTADEPGITRDDRRRRFFGQVSRFLSISWQVSPWPNDLKSACGLAEGFPEGMPIAQARSRVQQVIKMATESMNAEHRDRRFYTDETRQQLNSLGLGWSVVAAWNSWQLDAVRQTRAFPASGYGGWDIGVANNKDALTGREEAVAGGREWHQRCQQLSGQGNGRAISQEHRAIATLFKHEDWVGAGTLIKRVWHLAYLAKAPWNLEVNSWQFPFPDLRGLAAHDPNAKQERNRDDGPGNSELEADSRDKYFAVLAFDGDQIGKWISGEKTPAYESLLADYTDANGVERQGAKVYFERAEFEDFLKQPRLLSPGYHLQFSEALSQFALRCVRPIVEAYSGRLIYAGGDDVVALLPADMAIACAQALRCAFRGQTTLGPEGTVILTQIAPGVLTRERDTDDQGRPIPFLVPGPKADASVGIAMAHYKSPLQDVVRAAQSAEKRAKNQHQRSAVAVTLMKRSGEILEWGAKWDGGGLDLLSAIQQALKDKVVSAKFPHRIVQFVDPYRSERAAEQIQKRPLGKSRTSEGFTGEVARTILLRDLDQAVDRQRGSAYSKERVQDLRSKAEIYLEGISHAEDQVDQLIGLCQTAAFAHRTATETQS